MNIHLVVPGLLTSRPDETPEGKPSWPATTELLLARADKRPAPNDYPRTLFSLFGIPYPDQGSLPTANLCWLADTDQPPPPNLQHADPVHLRADMDRVLLFTPGVVTQQEAAELAAAFNRHFLDHGLVLHAPTPMRWYASSAELHRVKTQPLEKVLGRNMDPFLPTGEDARFWMQVFTEQQMLFFNQPVNTERERRGQLPINGLWFSGAGDLPTMETCPIGAVEGDEPLLNGLKIVAAMEHGEREAADRLLVFNEIQQAVASQDSAAWSNALQRLDARLNRLMTGPDTLVLYPCNGVAYHWKPSRRFYFWRR